MDFNLNQWRDQQQQQHESEEEQHHLQQQPSAKIPRFLHLESPQQNQQQQQQEVAALPLFVSAVDSQPNKITTSHLSAYSDHHSSVPPTAIPTRFPRVGGRYSFSMAQWQELELQALIYRHMVAGASVPPELLQLVKKSLLTSSTSYYFHHYSPHFQPAAAWYWGKGAMDPEPGRCRRTDGKKWRCSRDVVAGHKYCERHMHRGRNRSRKPVEFPAAATTASVSAGDTLDKPSTAAATTFSAAAETQFSLSRSGASSLDAFHINPRSSDKKTLFGPQLDSSSATGNGDKFNNNSNRVLMHLFDDWPRSDNGEGDTSSLTGLSISTPGNPTSDFLRLSTGNGDELGRRDRNGNEERERAHQMSWNAGGSMGGPLAEALRSSSNSSPTSVLHQLPRCSAPDTSFVSA